MNQDTAKHLLPGDIIALRGEHIQNRIDHLAKVRNVTRYSMTVLWARRRPTRQRIMISDIITLASLRRSAPEEKNLYYRIMDHEDHQEELDA